MTKDMTQVDPAQLRHAVKQRWGALTDRDLDTVVENLRLLPGVLRARYGYTGDQAEKEIALLLDNMEPQEKSASETVRETLSDTTPEEEAHVAKKIYKE